MNMIFKEFRKSKEQYNYFCFYRLQWRAGFVDLSVARLQSSSQK